MDIIPNTSFMSANHKYYPSPENPFISTRGNSGYGNKLQRDDNNTNLVLDEIALGNIALDEIIDNILTSRDEQLHQNTGMLLFCRVLGSQELDFWGYQYHIFSLSEKEQTNVCRRLPTFHQTSFNSVINQESLRALCWKCMNPPQFDLFLFSLKRNLNNK